MIKNVRVTRDDNKTSIFVSLRVAVSAAVIAVLALATVGLSGLTANASPSNPTYVSGNVNSCGTGTFGLGFTGTGQNSYDGNATGGDGNIAVTVNGSAPNQHSISVNITSTGLANGVQVEAVAVKAADGYFLYTPPLVPNAFTGPFITPNTSSNTSDQQAGLSHFFVCYDTNGTTGSTVPATSNIVTTASSNSSAGTISDTATVSGSLETGPTGTVTFFECGPLLANANCSTNASTPVDLSGNSATSATFTPTASGIYCFGATYNGDSNYPSATENTDGDVMSAECVSVTVTTGSTVPATSNIVTTASSNSSAGTISDTATVSGSLETGPTGTVTFFECGPLLANANCSANASTPVILSGSGHATSATFTPTVSGIYCFGATYSGDSNYSSASENKDGDVMSAECVPVTVTTPTIPTGSITVTPPTTTTTPTTTPSITPTTIQVSPPTTPHGTKPPKLPTATIPSGAPSTGAGGSATSSDSGVVLTASGLALFAGLAGLVLIARRRRHA